MYMYIIYRIYIYIYICIYVVVLTNSGVVHYNAIKVGVAKNAYIWWHSHFLETSSTTYWTSGSKLQLPSHPVYPETRTATHLTNPHGCGSNIRHQRIQKFAHFNIFSLWSSILQSTASLFFLYSLVYDLNCICNPSWSNWSLWSL